MTLRSLFSAVLVVCATNAHASEIDRNLKCAVQSFIFVSLATNKTDGVEVKNEDADKPIVVIYARDDATGFINEKFAYGTEAAKSTSYSKGYSAGATQYISKDGRDVITYFGVSGKYHVIVKYSHMSKNDGGPLTGFRSDSYVNALMYCVPAA